MTPRASGRPAFEISTRSSASWAFGVHEALDQLGAVLGPLLAAAVLAIRGDYKLAFALLLVPALTHPWPAGTAGAADDEVMDLVPNHLIEFRAIAGPFRPRRL